ncbi:MAG: DUF4202 domain-containing protein [Tepidisphaeraceae bacterium]|jgi:hypothetical protein
MNKDRFSEAIRRFDAANAADPNQIEGTAVQLLYARRMTDWLSRLYPDASEALRLAARSQHIRRWQIPRSQYPITRGGYHQWRTALYSFHAEEAGRILSDLGYDRETIAGVQSLLRKEKLKSNSDMQALEDVICLVFLEFELADFAPKHDEGKMLTILRRTWAKMSPRGHEAALQLNYSPELKALIGKALKPPDGPKAP